MPGEQPEGAPIPDELVRAQASVVSQRISEAAKSSISEEDLRIEVEKALADFSKALGIRLLGRHEYSVGKGRADSVYDYVVIEYKKPARTFDLSGSPAVREVSKQLKQRFKDLEAEEHRRITSLFGVGCNGHRFVFIRFRKNQWEESPPVPVTPQSTARFLRALLSLGARGKAFLPENLASDFAFDGGVAGPGVRALYESLLASKHPKVRVLFDEWKILFGEVCGYDVSKTNPKIERLAVQYGIGKDADPAGLMFSLHTYYAIFVKLLASEIVGTSGTDRDSTLAALTDAATPETLRSELEALEGGGVFRQIGVTNFLEGDLFAWYLSAWGDKVEAMIRGMVNRLDEYDPLTLSVQPEEERDLLKRLYQDLFPKEVRHDLGEYYTPDWLADFVLSEAGYDGSVDKRLIDPACGSGTFLIAAINRIRSRAVHENPEDSESLLASILRCVVGFDLNPIAVMTARANLLIALRDLFPRAGITGELPVYLCDSLLTPFDYTGDLFVDAGKIAQLPTSVGRFRIPVEVADSRATIAKYTEVLEASVTAAYSGEEFVRRLGTVGLPVTQDAAHRELIAKLCELDKARKNGVWARIIKNSFAPVFSGKADYVVGNPPWIRWTYLPSAYRQETKKLWRKYGLFTQKGLQSRMGTGETDISMLFTYVSADEYLVNGGKLAFLITQEVVKSKGAGEGFRRFVLPKDLPLKVDVFHDLSSLRPFEAANKTGLIVLTKGARTEYPVRYVKWTHEPHIGQLDFWGTPVDIPSASTVLEARPVKELGSPWQTVSRSDRSLVEKVRGNSAYKARRGADLEPYGVYFVKVLRQIDARHALVENVPELGDKEIPKLPPFRVETDLLYPVVRGKDVQRWRARPVYGVIVPNTSTRREDVPSEAWMKENLPDSYAYFHRQKDFLLGRGSQIAKDLAKNTAFYAAFGVGTYCFTKYKVLWKRMANDFSGVVVSSIQWAGALRPVFPAATTAFIPIENRLEAHFLCGALNSSPARTYLCSFSSAGRGFASPSVIQQFRLPRFDRKDPVHIELAQASESAHKAVDGPQDAREAAARRVDQAAARLWGIGPVDLKRACKSVEN